MKIVGLKPRGMKRKAGSRIKHKKRATGRIKSHRGKEKSISKLIKEADALFSKKVRMIGAWQVDGEWYNKCYTGGYIAPIKKLHCGHYLSRFYKAARWDFDNARPQSMMDNMWKRGDPITFRQNLVKEIGLERVEAVEAKRNESTKLSKEFLKELIASLS